MSAVEAMSIGGLVGVAIALYLDLRYRQARKKQQVHILSRVNPGGSEVACETATWVTASSLREDSNCLDCVRAELAQAREARAKAQRTIKALLPVERRLSRNKNRRRKA